MTDAIFVDTNVFVYARDASEKHKQPVAASWIERLWREQRGRTSMQVLSEYYVTVTRKLKPGLDPDEAWEDIQALFAWNPQQTDRELIALARDIERRYRLSWWDSLIVAAAQSQSCAILFSEDLHRGANYGGVTVQNPFAEEVKEESASYEVIRLANRRHRPRGRPSRATGS